MKKITHLVVRKSLSHIVGVAFIILPFAAHAQSETTSSKNSIFGEETQVNVGVGVSMAPRYMGSRDYRAMPVPILSITRGLFFADTIRGVGAQWQSTSGFFLSQAFFYDAGRVDHDNKFRPGSNRLAGMGDVSGVATSTLTIGQQLTPWLSISGDAEFGLDGHKRGTRYRVGIEATVFSRDKDTVLIGYDVRAADRQYNQTYFGVTAQQAQQSRFSSFTPGGGVNQYALNASWNHKVDDHWSTLILISASKIVGKAENSPVVERRSALTAAGSISYAF